MADSAESLSSIQDVTKADERLQSGGDDSQRVASEHKKTFQKPYGTTTDSWMNWVINTVWFTGEGAVIPDTLRSDITCHIHSSHLKVEGGLRQARECVYHQEMNYWEHKDFHLQMEHMQVSGPNVAERYTTPSWHDASSVSKGGNRSLLFSEQRLCDNEGYNN